MRMYQIRGLLKWEDERRQYWPLDQNNKSRLNFAIKRSRDPFLKINGLRIEFQIPSNCNWLPYSSSLSHQKFWLYFLEMQINGLGIEVVVKHCFGITDWKSLMCITTRYLFFIERNHGSLFFLNITNKQIELGWMIYKLNIL
jgi:hypothetical protein